MYNEGVIQDRFVSNRLDKASMVRATDWQISKRRVQESLTKVSSSYIYLLYRLLPLEHSLPNPLFLSLFIFLFLYSHYLINYLSLQDSLQLFIFFCINILLPWISKVDSSGGQRNKLSDTNRLSPLLLIISFSLLFYLNGLSIRLLSRAQTTSSLTPSS